VFSHFFLRFRSVDGRVDPLARRSASMRIAVLLKRYREFPNPAGVVGSRAGKTALPAHGGALPPLC
jgi:hypothetical protein